MHTPDLTKIVETHVRVRSLELDDYLEQLRQDVAPPLRSLEASGQLLWFSFLLHTTQQLASPKDDDGYIIHLRLEPSRELDTVSFVSLLPPHFLEPREVQLSAISPLTTDRMKDQDWASAWGVLGECSKWVLSLLDAYESGPRPEEIVQYLHFITNPLLLGHQSVFLPHSQTY